MIASGSRNVLRSYLHCAVVVLWSVLYPMDAFCGESVREMEFPASSITELVVDGRFGSVELRSGEGSRIALRMVGESDALEAVKPVRKGNLLSISAESKTVDQNVRVNSVVNHAEGGGSARVTIGGKTISAGVDLSSVRITVRLPRPVSLAASGVRTLRGKTHLSSVSLDLSGDTVVRLEDTRAAAITLDLAGGTDIFIGGVQESSVSIDAVGRNEVLINGDFSRVAVELVGDTILRTTGNVSGGYNLDLTGASKVHHIGTINGEVREDVVGNASFVVE